MKKIIFIVFLLGSLNFYGQGLNFLSPEEKQTFNKLPADKLGFAETLPYAYSLQKYVPPVLRQEGGTCVGFASFYYGLSTMYNIKFNLTDPKEKYVHSFDPYYIYSITFNESNDCDAGLYFNDAFEKLSKIGAKKLFYPPFTNCGTKWSKEKLINTFSYTTPYNIREWYILDVKNPKFLNLTKALISNNYPVIAGFSFVGSMYSYGPENINGVKSDGLWDPSELEEIEGGHALCIIGYDDYKFGGSFKIVNSWGRDYGDDGYMWVTYSDYLSFAKEAYVVELNENVKKLPPTVIDQTNYRRFNYVNNSNSVSSYEGQYINNTVTGYGIWSAEETNSFYIGKFNNSKMTGYFLYVNKDGIYSANAVNGELTDFNKLGFASDDSVMETQLEAKRYFSRLGSDLSIRKANSSRANLTSPK